MYIVQSVIGGTFNFYKDQSTIRANATFFNLVSEVGDGYTRIRGLTAPIQQKIPIGYFFFFFFHQQKVPTNQF